MDSSWQNEAKQRARARHVQAAERTAAFPSASSAAVHLPLSCRDVAVVVLVVIAVAVEVGVR